MYAYIQYIVRRYIHSYIQTYVYEDNVCFHLLTVLYIITRRWNKILAIPSILETIHTPYLAFIDADLIILDHDFDVYEDVIAHYPLADLILAEDVIGIEHLNVCILYNYLVNL